MVKGQPAFLPMSRREMDELGWAELDILFVTGDAYVDHPAFGTALLGRLLVEHGYRVGICAQPSWQDASGLLAMGRPRLFVGINSGSIDSMLAHYTAFRKKRHDDANTPGGQPGKRPNRACLVYANMAKQAFPGLPLVLGGIEASLRRVSHYDFWTDSLRRPLLLDSRADILIYGMGEKAIVECARRVASGMDMRGIAGTCWIDRLDADERPQNLPVCLGDLPSVKLPGHEDILADPWLLVELTDKMEMQVHSGNVWAWSRAGNRAVVLAPPSPVLDSSAMDRLYGLPFTRLAHPSYDKPVPAAEMLRTSITSHRGCGGGCSFCSIALHQGRRISSRSAESIISEIVSLRDRMSTRRGRGIAISDIGGPTANMWRARCLLPDGRACKRKSCCYPKICKFFAPSQNDYISLLRKAAALPGVKQVRVASGIRPDIGLLEPDALGAYAREFTGGQLKLAPEHSAAGVLKLMRKPSLDSFENMAKIFTRESRSAGKEQYIVPYLMSAFPGCTESDMKNLAAWLKSRGWRPEQCQCFIPTPGTMATAMFYCGRDENGRKIEVARSDAERLKQHHVLMPAWSKKRTRAGQWRASSRKDKRRND